jgi:hypothetical protein
VRRSVSLSIGIAFLVAAAAVALDTDYDLAKTALLAIKRMAAPSKTVEDPLGLRGLAYIDGVVVEGLSDDLRAAGLAGSAMRDVVATRLREGGLGVTGVPTIPTEHVYTRISGVELRTAEGERYGWYAVSVELSLRQPAYLERLTDGAAVHAWATTWDTTALVFSPQSDLRDDIASELARQAGNLLDDWRLANAKD